MTTRPPSSPDELFRVLAGHFPGAVDPAGSGFGARALKVGGRMFACLTKGKLLLKLPERRVDELVAARAGARLSTGGRARREWITLDPTTIEEWLVLATQARDFVSARPGSPPSAHGAGARRKGGAGTSRLSGSARP